MTHNITYDANNRFYCTNCGAESFGTTCLFNREFEIKEREVDEIRNKLQSEVAIKESELALKKREVDEIRNKLQSEVAIKEKELAVEKDGVFLQYILIAVLLLGCLMHASLLYVLYHGMDNIKEKLGEIVARM